MTGHPTKSMPAFWYLADCCLYLPSSSCCWRWWRTFYLLMSGGLWADPGRQATVFDVLIRVQMNTDLRRVWNACSRLSPISQSHWKRAAFFLCSDSVAKQALNSRWPSVFFYKNLELQPFSNGSPFFIDTTFFSAFFLHIAVKRNKLTNIQSVSLATVSFKRLSPQPGPRKKLSGVRPPCFTVFL